MKWEERFGILAGHEKRGILRYFANILDDDSVSVSFMKFYLSVMKCLG